MEESVEYKVLLRHTVNLQLAVKDNLTSLGGHLVAAEIITPDQYDKIRKTSQSPTDKGADLVGYVQNKVRQDPRYYHAFVGALKSDLSQYGGVLTKLEQARLPQASELLPVTPQPPPPRGGGNRLPAQGILFVLVLILGTGIPSYSLAQPITLSIL